MRYSRALLFFISVCIFSSCSQRASMPGRAFEGKIVQEISIDASALMQEQNSDTTYTAPNPKFKMPLGMNTTAKVTMYVRGDKVAQEVAFLGGLLNFPGRVIIDRNNRTMTVLMVNHAYVTDLRKLDSMKSKVDDSLEEHPGILDSLKHIVPKATGMKKTIKGLECEEYISNFKGMNIEMWVTQDPRLKFYDVVQDALFGKRRTGAMGGMEEIMSIMRPLSGEGRMPVTMTLSKDGKTFISSELKEMSEEKVSDDIFDIPKDYEVIKN